MKYIDEFRDGDLARKIAERLHDEAQGRSYSFMEFCGGHTHAIARYGCFLRAAVEWQEKIQSARYAKRFHQS